MPQKSTVDKKSFVPSVNFTKKSTHIDSYLYILLELSYLLYLEKHEPFNFALAKVKLRKALKLTFTAYKLQWEAV